MQILEGLRNAVRKLVRSTASYERSVNELIRDVQRTLIKADVNVKLVLQLSERIKQRALKSTPPPGVTRKEWLLKILYDELVNLFGGEEEVEVEPKRTPYIIMLVGIQGSGKTTSAAKIAYYYSKRGYKTALVCADTYRPAAYEQLRQLGEKIGVPVYGRSDNGDPIRIAVEGVKHFKQKGLDIIIIDTAGRHKEERELIEEMKNIAGSVNPNEIMLVIDAGIGQQALAQASAFHNATPIGSIMITKLDGTARGGGALTAVAVTGAKIKFVGVGEDVTEIEKFSPKRFVARILGMGDIDSLIEKIREAELEKELSMRQMEMIASGRLTLRDLYHQIIALRKLGPLSKILSMIPGIGINLPSEDKIRLTEEKMRKWIAIMDSMTYEELDKPERIDKSRIRRIALGSGTSPEEVKELLNYYKAMKRFLKQVRRRKDVLRRLGVR